MKYLLLIVVLVFIFFNQNTYVDLKDYQSETIHVEIKGEVQHPGVYEVDYNANVKAIIERSGGFTEEAEPSTINQAKVLQNADVIVVGKKSEIVKVSINSATLEQLVTLPGIGAATAQKIIDYRNAFGSFQSIEDIQNIQGIKEKLFMKIKDYITL